MSNDEMRMMSDSPHGKHFKADKIAGFIDVVIKDPPNDYQAQHRAGASGPEWVQGRLGFPDMGCRICVEKLGLSYPLGMMKPQRV